MLLLLIAVQTGLVLLLLSLSHPFAVFTDGFRSTQITYRSRTSICGAFNRLHPWSVKPLNDDGHHHHSMSSSVLSSYHNRYFTICSSPFSSSTSITLTCQKYDDHDEDSSCEVVGSNGRIGSFLLRALTDVTKRTQNNNDTDADASTRINSTDRRTCRVNTIKKGETPGISSERDTPIYVAIPATEVTKGKIIHFVFCVLFLISMIWW